MNEAKELLERGWKAREAHEFEMAETLLEQAYSLFIEQEEYFNATEALNHLAETKKLMAGVSLEKAIETAHKSLELAQEKGTKTDLVLRSLMSIYSTAGYYEQGVAYLLEIIEKTEKPAGKADYLSHLATFQLRMGDRVSAKESIVEAERMLDTSWDTEREPHRSIWKTRVLMTKAIIFYNLGDPAAKKYVLEAQKISAEMNLKTRLSQANRILALFK